MGTFMSSNPSPIAAILNNYRAENPGVLAKLHTLLSHGRLGGTGKVMILPVDQGFEHGPARSFAKNPALAATAVQSSLQQCRFWAGIHMNWQHIFRGADTPVWER